jgi:hypothetical protein
MYLILSQPSNHVQDPNIVYVNDDLRSMIKDGKQSSGNLPKRCESLGALILMNPF